MLGALIMCYTLLPRVLYALWNAGEMWLKAILYKTGIFLLLRSPTIPKFNTTGVNINHAVSTLHVQRYKLIVYRTV